MADVAQSTRPSPVAQPATAGVPELLEKLLELLGCAYCRDRISRFEMVAIWPVGGIVAHIGCHLRQHRAVTGEITP